MLVIIALIAPLMLILMMLNLLVIVLLELMITVAPRSDIGLAGTKRVNSYQPAYRNLYTIKAAPFEERPLFFINNL